MGTGERPSALASVEGEAERPQRLHVGRALHVAQLTPVEPAVRLHALGPAEVDVARGLHHPLPLHHALAVLLVAALRQVVLEHRGRGLLDLQEERVLLIASLEQDDERPRADATDTHDLAGDVDDLESLEQVASVILQRGPVGAELLMDRVLHSSADMPIRREELT